MADTVVQELVINTLTQAQFDSAKEAGTLSPYELYGTPDTSADRDLMNITDGAKELMANASMPSDTYKDFTLGASGNTYTAPADGWFYVRKNVGSSNTNQWLTISNTTTGISSSNAVNYGGSVELYVPVKAGDKVKVSYDASGTTGAFKFIYAEGSKHLA